MSLDLDERQRAMLQEMGVRVWWPMAAQAAEVAVLAPPRSAPTQDARAQGTAPRRLPQTATAPTSDAPASRPAPVPAPADAVAPGSGADLPMLAQAVSACQACRLCEGRKTAVFAPAAAARQTDWMVVGDPPTDEDERAASPFAGEGGVLLDNMLRAVQCRRDGEGPGGAWLTHVVKCRPAHVRNPQSEELAQCALHLRREVALLRPRVILALGRFAALSLLTPAHPELATVPPGKLRGRLYQFEGVPVVVSYSPARLLRAPAEKAGAWADLCLARAAIAQAPDAGAA